MSEIKSGVEDESFEVSLAQSNEAVDKAMEYLSKYGMIAIKLERRPDPAPDDGDILTFKYNESGEKYWCRTVDVKRNSNWSGSEFPFDTVYVTEEKQFHHDWIYMIFNTDMTAVAIFDMTKINASVAQFDETTNRRGGNQVSVGIPTNLASWRNL